MGAELLARAGAEQSRGEADASGCGWLGGTWVSPQSAPPPLRQELTKCGAVVGWHLPLVAIVVLAAPHWHVDRTSNRAAPTPTHPQQRSLHTSGMCIIEQSKRRKGGGMVRRAGTGAGVGAGQGGQPTRG